MAPIYLLVEFQHWKDFTLRKKKIASEIEILKMEPF